MNTQILQPTAENLLRAGNLICKGEIVAFPTETVYGLGADAFNVDACQKIYAAKNRPHDKPLTLHVADFEMIDIIAEISLTAEKLIERFLPGPLTIILPKKKIVPDFVTCNSKSVGVRFPNNTIAQDLIKFAGVPLAAPSANISGKNPPTTAQEVFENLGGKLEIILDGGECEVGISSTIVDISAGDLKILRQGKISVAQILATLA
ncbi:MAG: threonylcarbamoyl-AMP synthase [Selenomonadaceae bacterium]|nr:threonylcarbamoyl-AMP synthase [Selenomonadaceae bacterium]